VCRRIAHQKPLPRVFRVLHKLQVSCLLNSSPETASKGVQGPAQASGVLLVEQLTRNCFQGCSGSCTSFRCTACSPQGSRKCCNEGPTRLEEGPSPCEEIVQLQRMICFAVVCSVIDHYIMLHTKIKLQVS
jgi:hypothetical protein